MRRLFTIHAMVAIVCALWLVPIEASRALADDAKVDAKAAAVKAAAEAAKKKKQKFPKWDEVIKDTKKLEGLFPLYYDKKGQRLFMEIGRNQYDKELILPMAISRGSGWFLGGDTLNFGDQWVITFHRAADKILVTRKNVYVRAKSGSPQADAVKISHTDSVIAALKVKSEQSGGSKVLIDLRDLLMTDLAGLGFTPDRARSTWGSVKAFPHNIEIEVNAVFNMYRGYYFYFFGGDTPDPRGTQIGIHYGFSMLSTKSGYKPRVADDRVGHFLSVVKDFSKDTDKTPYVRYATRWNLVKANPDAEKSPPKEPIIFWIEKSVPRQYRPYVKAGILEWNKAFEKIGFIDAIQVRDQQSRDEFDPEDIRYNTFRWITTSSAFAMGPSRTNPKTGQILDADILFDESMVRYRRQEYLLLAGLPESLKLARQGPRQAWLKLHVGDLPWLVTHRPAVDDLLARMDKVEATHDADQARFGPPSAHAALPARRGGLTNRCQFGPGIQRQLGFLAAVLQSRGMLDPGGKVPEKFIGQAIKEVTMHEVGHTLGLRHNFKASTMLSLKECNDPKVTHDKGMAGSVMDYLPVNIALKGEEQGDYFSQTIGPYDYWAIEYAYKPIKGDEAKELAKIASRVAEPDLAYGTDEDLSRNPDPRINLYDLGDPLDFSKSRVQLAQQQLEDLAKRVVAKGEGWQRARDAFSKLLSELSSATYLSAQYVGGEYNYRDHRGDPNARTPLAPIPVEKQRDAIQFLEKNILSGSAFHFSPELLKRLAPEYWRNRGYYYWYSNYQYPIYDQVLSIQRIVLSQFLNSSTLRAIQNAELHVDDPKKALTLPEVFASLTDSIWSELPPADKKLDGKLDISTIRRNLQREHVKRLAGMVLGPRQGNTFYGLSIVNFYSSSPPPADARALARHHLSQLEKRLDHVLDDKESQITDYARAHLEEMREQITKVLDASLEASRP